MSPSPWPMSDIRLATPDLRLRHLTEADLPAVAAILPADAEQDPALTTYEGLDPAGNRAVRVYQSYWRSLGLWRPESWMLTFGAFHDGNLVGCQALEGDDFATLRTVDSWSFLSQAVRGRGFGKQMRAAVLTLAFGHLGARFAVTSAWADNHASLGVSRSLGYADNGVTAHRRGEGAGEMAHLRLTEGRWAASDWPRQVTVSGVEACLPYFGLAAQTAAEYA